MVISMAYLGDPAQALFQMVNQRINLFLENQSGKNIIQTIYNYSEVYVLNKKLLTSEKARG